MIGFVCNIYNSHQLKLHHRNQHHQIQNKHIPQKGTCLHIFIVYQRNEEKYAQSIYPQTNRASLHRLINLTLYIENLSWRKEKPNEFEEIDEKQIKTRNGYDGFRCYMYKFSHN